jgi:hypothetical protein
MIKARAEMADGRSLLLLGLSRANTKHLLKGRPLVIDTRDELLLKDGPVIFLCAGETETDMHKELQQFISQETIVIDTGNQEKPS